MSVDVDLYGRSNGIYSRTRVSLGMSVFLALGAERHCAVAAARESCRKGLFGNGAQPIRQPAKLIRSRQKGSPRWTPEGIDGCNFGIRFLATYFA